MSHHWNRYNRHKSLCPALVTAVVNETLRVQAAEAGQPPSRTSKFYAKGALQYLVPILTTILTRQVRAIGVLRVCCAVYLVCFVAVAGREGRRRRMESDKSGGCVSDVAGHLLRKRYCAARGAVHQGEHSESGLALSGCGRHVFRCVALSRSRSHILTTSQ